jgi:hypothetical protein
MSRTLLALITTSALLSATGAAYGQASAPAGNVSRSAFRVRSDFSAKLNADHGWAAPLNENCAIYADRPFRLRFEVERPVSASGATEFRLQYRRNRADWTDLQMHRFPKPEAKTPRVSIVACHPNAYKHGAATVDLLRGSTAPFQAGAGVSRADRTPPWKGPAPLPAVPSHAVPSHTEFEWPLVVRRFADGAVTNEPDDTFEFRMVEAGGTVITSSPNPLLRLAVPRGHVGGTFVETPGRIGPWQAANGDLYFIMEPAETSNLFMMLKSTDDGATWREVDGANRPKTKDLESVDARQVGDTLHILHQITPSCRYHTFRTSDHPEKPDTWAVRDEPVAFARSVAQATTLAVRSDGTVVAFFVGQTVQYSIRSPAGVWSAAAELDPDNPATSAGPQAVLGANDSVHVAYHAGDGTIWYRRLLADGTLAASRQVASGVGTTRAEYGAVLPLVYLPESRTVVVIYRLSDGKLWERRIASDGEPTAAVRVTDRDVVRHAVDSQQPGADAVADGPSIRVLFIEQSSGDIFSTHSAGGWRPSQLEVENIRGSWVRGNVYTRSDGVRVYGYIYDAGSDGGSGMNRFAERVLDAR